MKQTVDASRFCEEFKAMGRGEQFSRSGLTALFEHLTEIEQEGDEIELDVIGLCCEYTEYEDMEEFREQYGNEYATVEDVEEATSVILVEPGDGFIAGEF